MPVEFAKTYKRMLARYKWFENKDTLKVLTQLDVLGNQLAQKDISANNRTSLEKKLEDTTKRLKLLIKDEIKERTKEVTQAVKDPDEDLDVSAFLRTFETVKREIQGIEKKITEYSKDGGKPPPPPKLPQLHYLEDYKKIVTKNGGTLLPSAVTALQKLDQNHEAKHVTELGKAARTAVKTQTTKIQADAGKEKDLPKKAGLNHFAEDLIEMTDAIKSFEMRVFLIHRLK